MQLLDFLKSLLPRMDKSNILEDLRVTKNELESGLIPCYNEAVKYLGPLKFKSEALQSMTAVFYRNLDIGSSRKETNFVGEIEERLPFIQQNLAFIDSELDAILEKDIIKDGLTAKKAVLVRAAEHISFITRYATDLLSYVYANETAALTNSELSKDDISPVQLKRIEQNWVIFTRLFSIYSVAPKDFTVKYKSIPDVVVNVTNHGIITSTFKETVIDPFGSPLLQNFESNPIYHFRLMVAEWQADRYKAFKDRKRQLELRLLHLKSTADKKPDPKVEQEIGYLEGRIDTLKFKMQKIEDSVK